MRIKNLNCLTLRRTPSKTVIGVRDEGVVPKKMIIPPLTKMVKISLPQSKNRETFKVVVAVMRKLLLFKIK